MSQPPLAGAAAVFGYALGVGLVFVPVLGIPARFAFQGPPAELIYAGAFLLGALLGALFAPRRNRET